MTYITQHQKLYYRKKTLLPVSIAFILAIIAGVLAYRGAISRPLLIPDPLFAGVVISFCILILLIPFITSARSIKSFLSPEVMGGIGYFIYIGVGAVTNHMKPGLAVNPSLFPYMPVAILAQTAGAFSFFVGTKIGSRYGKQKSDENNIVKPYRLAIILFIYSLFALYLTILMPRQESALLHEQTVSNQAIPWVFTVGPFIVFQSIPMIVAAFYYLRTLSFILIRFFIIGVLSLAAIFFITSGSRTYASEVVFILLISQMLAEMKVRKILFIVIVCFCVAILLISTLLRLSGTSHANINVGTISMQDVINTVESIGPSTSQYNFNEVNQNIFDNFVYHLSDNQTMAMLIRNSDRGMLWGNAFLYSIFSGLPRSLRPIGTGTAVNLIVNHYMFYKEVTADAYYSPDWQMTMGVLGFADFNIAGLIIYPLLLGLLIRWIYNRIIYGNRLGKAGWLAYVPIIELLWFPSLLGPDFLQLTRLLIPLAIGLYWCTRN